MLIHIIAGISRECSVVWIDRVLFFYSLVGGHLDCFYFLGIVNRAPLHTSVKASVGPGFSIYYQQEFGQPFDLSKPQFSLLENGHNNSISLMGHYNNEL